MIDKIQRVEDVSVRLTLKDRSKAMALCVAILDKLYIGETRRILKALTVLYEG